MTLIARLEIYALILIAALGLIAGAYFKGRGAGVEAQKLEDAQERESERVRTDKLREDSDHVWQGKLDTLQTRLDGINSQPHEPIRLCKPSSMQLPAPAGSAHAAPEGSGQSVPSGQDLYGSILVFATQCERDRQQLGELQAFIEGVTKK